MIFFSILTRGRSKLHLAVLEALYIRTSLLDGQSKFAYIILWQNISIPKNEQKRQESEERKNSIQIFFAITGTETEHKSEKMAVGGNAATKSPNVSTNNVETWLQETNYK